MNWGCCVTDEYPRLISPIPCDIAAANKSKLPKDRRGAIREQVWPWKNASGLVLKVTIRFPDPDRGKLVLPYTLWEIGSGRYEWMQKDLPPSRPLYGLDRLAARPDAPVMVHEGEKACVAAEKLFPEYVHITSGSCTSAGNADWEPLRGRKVVGWPDHDVPGRKYAQEVQSLTIGVVHSFATVQIPDEFPEKWDLADPLPGECTLDHLRELLEAAKGNDHAGGSDVPMFPALGSRTTEQERGSDGAFLRLDIIEVLAAPPPPVRFIVPGLLPMGMEGIFAAPPGLGKSRLMLEWACRLAAGLPIMGCPLPPGTPRGAIFYSAEDGHDSMARRIHSLMDLLRADGLDADHEHEMQRYLQIYLPDPRKGMRSLANERDWFTRKAAEIPGGTGLIVLDTLSRVNGTHDENNAAANAEVVNASTLMAHATGASVVLNHHLVKSASETGNMCLTERLDVKNTRGSGAFIGGSRFLLLASLLNQAEAGKAGLDEDKALSRGFAVLSLSKFNDGTNGAQTWTLLERIPQGEPGEGQLQLHLQSTDFLAPLRGGAAKERLGNADLVLMEVFKAGGSLVRLPDRKGVAARLFPKNKNPENAFNKAIGDLRKARPVPMLEGDHLTDAGRSRCLNLFQTEAPAIWTPSSAVMEHDISATPTKQHSGRDLDLVPQARNNAEQEGTSLVPLFSALGSGTAEQGAAEAAPRRIAI